MKEERSLLKAARQLGKGLIYRAYNKITHKSYIGQTKFTLEHRKVGHYRSAWAKNGSSTIHFMKALRKYKQNDWDWTILDSRLSLEQLDDREIYRIAQFNTYKDGYNSTTGGQGYTIEGEIHSLYHVDYGIVSGSSFELYNDIGIKSDSLSQLKLSKVNQWYGWILEKNKDKYNKLVIKNKKHKIYSRETGIVTGSGIELKAKYNVNVASLNFGKSVNGFVWASNKDDYSKTFMLNIFEHIETGKTVEMTRIEFASFLGVEVHKIQYMLKKYKEGHIILVEGWKYVDIKYTKKELEEYLKL